MSMKVTVENNELVIRMPLQKPAASKSGKTKVVATTRGNVKTGTKIHGAEIILGLNAYIKPDEDSE